MTLPFTPTVVELGERGDKDIAKEQAEEKDRQASNNEVAKEAHEKATDAARRKKEKKFQDTVNKPK